MIFQLHLQVGLDEISHPQLINALSRVEELKEYIGAFKKKSFLTGKVLLHCNSAADLVHVGIDNSLLQSVFFESYLVGWKSCGLPLEMLESVRSNVDIHACRHE